MWSCCDLRCRSHPNPKSLHFYKKLKLQKEGNPERPVIISINCHNPIVKEVPSYIQDTTSFFRKINQTGFVPDN